MTDITKNPRNSPQRMQQTCTRGDIRRYPLPGFDGAVAPSDLLPAAQPPAGQRTALVSRRKAQVNGTLASMAVPNASGARYTSTTRQANDTFAERGTDEQILEIRAIEVTSSSIGDSPMLPGLLSQIAPGQEIGSVTADGAYDTRKCRFCRDGDQADQPSRVGAIGFTLYSR